MAQMAVGYLDFMRGTLKQLAIGLSTGMHLRNVQAHVQNALHHTERSPEIDAAAAHLLRLADEFGRRHGGLIVGKPAIDARDQHLAGMETAYLALRKLIENAKPSQVSSILGSG